MVFVLFVFAYVKGKKGPIYALDWNPVRDEFIVVYGSKYAVCKK